MNISDIFFGAHLDDTGLLSEAKISGDKAGQTIGTRMSQRLSGQAKVGLTAGIAAAASTQAFTLLGTATSGIVSGITDAIQAASNLNESASKSKVIFGDAAGAMDNFASHAAEGLGLSKQAALEAAATFGNFFTGIGQSQGEAEKMSEKLVGLAGDLASFNNLDPSAVLDKLRSGLTGEAEPLRSVGVFLTEAKVKAEGMKLGLADAHGELSEGAKVMARYKIILDETTTAQGDFSRTADGLANSQRIANAEMENAKAKFGQALLPASTLFDKIATKGIEGLGDFADKTEQAGEAFGDFVRRGVEGWQSFLNPTGTVPAQIKPVIDSLDEAGSQARNTSHDFGDLRIDAQKLADKFTTTKSTVDDLAGAMALAEGRAHDLAGTLEDDLYGAAARAGRRADLAGQIGDLEKKLSETKDKRSATIIRGQIADLRRSLMDLDLQIAESKGPKALQDQLDTWKAKFKNTDAKAYDLVLQLQAMYRAAGRLPDVNITVHGVSGGGGSLKFATGGSLYPGQHATVGEEGPEDLYNRAGVAVVVPRTPGLAGIRAPQVGPIGVQRAAAAASAGAAGGAGGNTYATTLVIPDAKGHDPYAVFDRLGRDVRWGRLNLAREPGS